jgi:hypothetical protein
MTHAQAKQIFATHMQAARKRKLAPYETKQLSQARQVLRMHARPAMNKPPRVYTCPQCGKRRSGKLKSVCDYCLSKPNRAKVKSNPGKPVLIYGNVTRILATKSQNHICDAECKAANHRYFHDFKSKPKMYGLPDGSLLIKA